MIATLALAALAAPAEAPELDFRGYLDQARFFIKREWYADAAEQLELAVATEDGRLDPAAWFLLATVRYELADLAGARDAADLAHMNSRTPDQERQAAELLLFFEQQFGFVRLVPPHAGMATRVDVQLVSVIFDPQLKVYFNKLVGELEGRLTLPYALGLPAGTYRINGDEVVVGAGSDQALEVRLRGGGWSRLQVVELEAALGASAWFGEAARSMLPAPSAQVAISVPIGPIVVGAGLDWSPRPFRTRTGSVELSGAAWTAGGRVGSELPGTQPLVLRPSVGFRSGLLPGVELACTQGGSGATCGPEDSVSPRELYVYAVGVVHIPYVELAALYNDRSRASGLGVGVKAAAQQALGTVPDAGDAPLLDTATDVAWTVPPDARPFRATGIRVLASLSYAF